MNITTALAGGSVDILLDANIDQNSSSLSSGCYLNHIEDKLYLAISARWDDVLGALDSQLNNVIWWVLGENISPT